MIYSNWEYYCRGCDQLRLWAQSSDKPAACGNCGSADIVVGEIGELDKEHERTRALDDE